MTRNIEDYRREFEGGNIEEFNYPLVVTIVKTICPNYPAEIYSPDEIWNEAVIIQLANEFFTEILLKKDRLKYLYLVQETLSGLKKAIQQDFTNFLRNKKKRTEATNIYQRMMSTLTKNTYFKLIKNFPKSNARIFSLTDEHCEIGQTCQELSVVVNAMFSIETPPLVRYRADSKKHSHLIDTKELEKLLTGTFQIVKKPIRVKMLMEALIYRLGITEIDLISLDEEIESQDDEHLSLHEVIKNNEPTIETRFVAHESAEKIFERITDNQRFTLALRMAGYSLEETAKKMNKSKTTISDYLKKIETEISLEQATEEETEIIMQHLVKLCVDFNNSKDE